MTRVARRGRTVAAGLATALVAAAAPTLAGAVAPSLTATAVTAEVPGLHALTGARIIVRPGRVIETGTLVLRDGIVEAVGAAVEPPAGARIWELAGMTLYPGLIDPYTVREIEANEARGREERDEEKEPETLVRPGQDILPAAWDEEAFEKLRRAGYTTAVVAPAGGIFRGQGVLLNLGGVGGREGESGGRTGAGELAANLLAREAGHHVTIEPRPGGGSYPASLMGAVALVRQTFLDARWHGEAQAAYRRQPAQARPPLDPALTALEPATAGREVVVFETETPFDTLRVAGLARELGLEAWVVGNGREYRWLEEIATTGLPHLLPVAFPEPPDVGEEDDLAVGLDELRHWDLAPENPRRLVEAGVTVAFTTHLLEAPSDLHDRLAKAIERGLTPDQALAGVTTVPAELLGIADRAGTLEPGKMANLVVADGDLFTSDTDIREVWIDGRRYEIEDAEAPEVEPAGTWELMITRQEGPETPVVVELAGEAAALTGTVAAGGATAELTVARVSGSSLELRFPGEALGFSGEVSMVLQIRGERASGRGDTPDGPLTVEGRRTRKPERGGAR